MTRFVTLIRQVSLNISLYALASSTAFLGCDGLSISVRSNSNAVVASDDSTLVVAVADTHSESPKAMRERGSGR
jgi:hypothetical protein